MKQLTIDEMLEICRMAKIGGRAYERLAETVANLIAAEIAGHFKVQVLHPASFEPAFGGTCVDFGPPDNGAKTCPYALSLFDPGDWEGEHGVSGQSNDPESH